MNIHRVSGNRFCNHWFEAELSYFAGETNSCNLSKSFSPSSADSNLVRKNNYLEFEQSFGDCVLFLVKGTDFYVLFLSVNVLYLASSLDQNTRKDALFGSNKSHCDVFDVGLFLLLENDFDIFNELVAALLEFWHFQFQQHRTVFFIRVLNCAFIWIALYFLSLFQLRTVSRSVFVIVILLLSRWKQWCGCVFQVFRIVKERVLFSCENARSSENVGISNFVSTLLGALVWSEQVCRFQVWKYANAVENVAFFLIVVEEVRKRIGRLFLFWFLFFLFACFISWFLNFQK